MSFPRMSWHIGDYKKDTGHLRAAGHGAYFMLCMHYWATGGLPDDDKQLATIACMTDREWREHKPMIQPLFKGDGPWKHKRIEKELASAQVKYEKRSKAGKDGNAKRWASQKASQNDRIAIPDDIAMPSQPITDNRSREIDTRAREIFPEFMKAIGADADDPMLLGITHQLSALLARGFTRETILAGAVRAMIGKQKIPSWQYFVKVIETENAERSAPAKPERTDGTAGNVIQAADRLIERMQAFDERPAGLRRAAGADSVRAISEGSS